MIEKQKGMRWINTLQLIELLGADFNSALNSFFAKEYLTIAYSNNSLADEQ